MGRRPLKIALLPLFLLPPFLVPPTLDPSDRSNIDALAPFEVVAEGFKEPMGAVVDPDGAILVSDRKAGEVLEISAGEVHSAVTGLKRPVGLAFDGGGKLLIVEGKAGILLRLEADGRFTLLAEGMRKPRWIAVSEDGTIYLSAQGIKRKKDRGRGSQSDDNEKVEGEVILRLTPAGELKVWASGFKGLEGLIVHEEGLFVAAKGLKKEKRLGRKGKREDRGGVYRISTLDDGSAGPITRVSHGEVENPVGLVRDFLGAFYVSAKRIEAEEKIKGTIGKVSPTGALSRFASRIKKPSGLALDRFGNLYVACYVDYGKGKEVGHLVRFRAPPPPTLTVPLFTNQSLLALSGTTELNSRIDAFLNDSNPPATFSTKDGNFSLTLQLAPNTHNSLAVFTTAQNGEGLTSAPAGFTIIHDNTPPLITNITPLNGSLLNDPTPQIRADFSDNFSGIDVNNVAILLDGFDVTSQAQVTAAGFTLDLVAPLIEGPHTATVNVSDLAGNTASLSATFIIDATSPVISNLSPSGGTVISTATPLISADFSDNPSGVGTTSVSILLDGADVTSQASISATGFTLVALLSQDFHTVSVSVSDLAGNSASATSTFTVSMGPGLGPIGDQVVEVGSTLSFTVSATNSSGGVVNLAVTPLPLPTNAIYNAASGLFTFSPDLGQVGSFDLTFTGTSGGQSDSETITITVRGPATGTVTALTGQLLDSNDFAQGITTPVAGATVSLLGTGVSTTSDINGDFTLSGITASIHVLDIDSSTAGLAPDGSSYAGFREEIELIPGVNNVFDRPLFIPRIAADSLTTVNPNFFTIVTNPDLGVSLTVPPNTAKDENGNNFTGELSISLVPRDLAPAELPDFLDPGLLVTIQPVGVTFSTPVPITFPNIDNLPPGSEVNIWSLDAETGTFVIVGTGLVSPDGTRIDTISGGIRSADWHLALAAAGEADDSVAGAEGPIKNDPKATQCSCTSTLQVQDGSIGVDFSLPSYRSLGISRSLRFLYNSQWANPRPVIPFNSTIPVRAAVPPTLSYRLSVGGVEQEGETFVDTSRLSENIDETIRSAASFDATNLNTGLYPYTIRLTSNYAASRVSSDVKGQALVRNEAQSPLGAGWALTGIERLFTNYDGSLSVISGDGSLILFTSEETSPPFVNFSSPAGDFSALVKNPDGTFIRSLKDGTQINYDSQGLEISMVDRNGNTTSYDYDTKGRLISITDPANLVTTFTYTGDFLSSVTDPANRTTSFQHDADGDLSQVTFPDGTNKSFGYDDRHLMTSETDQRGNTSQRVFDSLGRFISGTRRDSSPAAVTNIQSVGFVDLASGTGSETNPAPVVRPDEALSTLTDGNSNTTSFETDGFGATIRQVNALGQETLIERDENGSPTKITRPNGAVLAMSYDVKGNLLTSTDPVGATTTFTYDPNFSQVTSITDPKNNSTTINYDTNGNPIEIIDALGNETQMTYDSRGLLTSVTSAVGAPEENTTTFTYDATGNLLTTTDPLLNTTTLEYDNAGNVIKSTNAENRVTEFTYDSMNRLVSVLDPNNGITSYSYDAKGNLTKVTDTKNQTTTFAYDEMDRLISATNPLGLMETFTYDANGNLTSTTNRNGQTLTFDYDALNRLIKKTLPPSPSQVGLQITTFDYDPVGNLTAVINPATKVAMRYDQANRLISSISSAESTVVGEVTIIDQDTLIGEDNLDFEGKTLQVDGKTLTVEGSHLFANLSLVNGAVLTHSQTTGTTIGKLDLTITGILQVDAISRIDVTARGFLGGRQASNPFGSSAMTLGFQQGSTLFSGGSYGGLGGSGGGSPNPVYGDFRDPNNVGSGGASFSSAGRGGNGGGLVRIVAEELNLEGQVITNGGDGICCAGGGSGGGIRIDVGTLRGTGQITANGGRGLLGNGSGGGGRIAVYYQALDGFDLVNQVSAVGGAGNGASNGQNGTVFLQQTFAMWTPMDGEVPVMKAEIQKNRAVQLASLRTVPLGLKPDTVPVKIPDIEELIEKIQVEIGQAERPQRRVFSSASIRTPQPSSLGDKQDDFDPIYNYDLNGNRISMIDPTGLTTYTYDPLNRLTSITNPNGETTTFTYDALGRRTSMTHDNGVVTNYTYDAASQLLSLVHQLGATTINSFNYTYDKVGNRKTKGDSDGVANYTYDALNRLVEAVNPLPSNPLESFTYDGVGNRVDSNQNGTSTFNAANQLTEDNTFNYIYDENGNQVQKTNKSTLMSTVFEYDAENKLIRVTSLDKTVNYKYDGLGRRIEKEVTETGVSAVTRYIYDNEDILLELDDNNDIVVRYTHGPGIDEPLIMDKGGASFFYHGDGLGTVTELTDSVGTVVQSYAYSSFGKIESQLDPNFIQPYTFTAREFDAETGLYFYRARAYDPLIGRFLQEDPFLRKANPDVPYLLPFVVRHPALLNQYGYVVNNPTNFVDPGGTSPALVIKTVKTAVCIVGQAANLISLIRQIEELDREREAIQERIKALEQCREKSDAEKLQEFRELQKEISRIFSRKIRAIGKGAAVSILILPFCVT